MRLLFLTTLLVLFYISLVCAAEGVIVVKSAHTVTATLDRLEAVLQRKGMTIFARIDHAAGAESVGLDLRPTELLIFGNPKVGTPLMQCQQSVAIDLPQKALVWQAEDGQVWLSYNDPQYLKARHSLDSCAEQALQKVAGALAAFSQAATAP